MKAAERKTGVISGHAGRIVLTYVAVGALWILFSDLALHSLASNEEILSRIQTYKDLIFIGITATLLFVFIRRADASLVREYHARRKSEQRYRDFLAHNVAGTWQFELRRPMPLSLPIEEQIEWMLDHSVLVECNDVAVQMYGLAAEDVLGKTHREIFVHDEQGAKETLRAWSEGGYKLNGYESLAHLHTGEDRWFLIMGHGVIEDGHLVRSWGTQVDITERKQAQHALQESNERYQRLVEGIQDEYFIYSHNPDGVFTYLSPSITNVLGYAQAEYFSHYSEAITDHPINRAANLHTEASIRGEQQPSYEVEAHHKDGGVRVLEILEQPVFDKQGQVIAVEGIAHDITEHKQAEEALRESEKKFSTAFHSSPDTITISRLQDGKFLEVNEGFEKMTGISREEIIGRTSLEMNFWEEPADRADLVARLELAKRVREVEYRFRRRSGEVFIGLYSGELIDIDGEACLLSVVSDITERKRAEEERDRLFNLSIDMMGVAGFDGYYKQVNPAFTKTLGWSKDELLRRPWLDLVHPDDQESTAHVAEELLKGKPLITFENRCQCKDGSYRWLSWSSFPLLEEEVGFVVARDITDHKRVEEALRLTQYAVDNCHTAIYWHGSDGRTLYANDVAFQQLGYSREELLDLSVSDFDPDWPADYWPKGWQKLKEARVMTFESRHRRKDGHIFPVQVTTNYFEFDGVEHVFAFVSDVTEQRLAMDALRDSETKLHAIFDHHYQLTGLLDRDGRLLAANRTALEFAGAHESEVIGQFFWDSPWWDPSQQPKARDAIECAARGEFVRFELTHIRADGAVRDFDFSLSPVRDDNGKVIYLVPEGRDITDRKRMEDELQVLTVDLEKRVKERTAQLAAVNEELEAFAYSVSHDLRAPLRAISGFSEIISRRYQALLPDQGRHYFENVVEASGQMERLIDDLLKYSRLGRRAVEISEISLDVLFDSLKKKFTPMLENADANLDIPSACPTVLGNLTLLEQIFSNLIDNAIKYHRPDTPAKINIECAQMEGDLVAISVRDNGVGIPATMQEKVFNIFQRLHREEDISGTGIGLALVKKSVDLVNGSINIKSVLGEGSTFAVNLRAAKGHA